MAVAALERSVNACRRATIAPAREEARNVIIVMKGDHTEEQLKAVVSRIEEHGLRANVSRGTDHTVIGVIGDVTETEPGVFALLKGVERVFRASRPYKIVARETRPEGTRVRLGEFEFGGDRVGVIAGPCTVENRDQILRAAERVKQAGAIALRGGAFKPRTSPYSFRGLEEKGLQLLAEAREATGLPVVTEVMQPADVDLVGQYADMYQIGARNMQNFQLLEAVGRTSKPALLKRGMSATLEELLFCAEYIARSGNMSIILCERGIRTFETWTRNTLSLAAVPYLKEVTHLPVIVDPSHGVGLASIAPAAMLGAVAMGADGLIVECHPDPAGALVDGDQSLDPETFAEAMRRAARVAEAVGRTM